MKNITEETAAPMKPVQDAPVCLMSANRIKKTIPNEGVPPELCACGCGQRIVCLSEQEEDARYEPLWKETIKIQPDLPKLKRILLKIGGECLGLYLKPEVDPDIPRLIEYGFVMHGPVIRIRNLEPHACHTNVATLWKANNRKIVSIGTGYALVGEICAQHTWGITRNGSIVETKPCDRSAYFGFICGWLLGDVFAEKDGVGR
jgi:hypothetical protein